ncbi:MAG: hypothetical protein IJD68_03360 [Ruminococcus sp.]|nr:hypothetical protein [Ruminococcus sp.]
MADFFRKKKPMLKSEQYYEQEQESLISKAKKFPIFVGVSVACVIIIFGIVFFTSFSNNALKMFVDSSSQNFDSGSFDYHINADLNGVTYLEYEGQLEFYLPQHQFKSVYHANYEDYEYDAVVYTSKDKAYCGNLYGGKWSIEDYTEKALDFFSFYKSYRKNEFDAGAFVRFTDTTDTFSAVPLEEAASNIAQELSKQSTLENVLHQQLEQTEGGNVVTFTPELEKVFDIVLKHIGSAYTSANEFSQFKERIEQSQQNLENAQTKISYKISKDGYLTDIYIEHEVNGDCYVISVSMSNFSKAEVVIPDGFTTAAGLE